MKKLSEELTELNLAFYNEKETQGQEERFYEIMRLLNSAPELLEACKIADRYLNTVPGYKASKLKNELQSAIAKAEGWVV